MPNISWDCHFITISRLQKVSVPNPQSRFINLFQAFFKICLLYGRRCFENSPFLSSKYVRFAATYVATSFGVGGFAGWRFLAAVPCLKYFLLTQNKISITFCTVLYNINSEWTNRQKKIYIWHFWVSKLSQHCK